MDERHLSKEEQEKIDVSKYKWKSFKKKIELNRPIIIKYGSFFISSKTIQTDIYGKKHKVINHVQHDNSPWYFKQSFYLPDKDDYLDEYPDVQWAYFDKLYLKN